MIRHVLSHIFITKTVSWSGGKNRSRIEKKSWNSKKKRNWSYSHWMPRVPWSTETKTAKAKSLRDSAIFDRSLDSSSGTSFCHCCFELIFGDAVFTFSSTSLHRQNGSRRFEKIKTFHENQILIGNPSRWYCTESRRCEISLSFVFCDGRARYFEWDLFANANGESRCRSPFDLYKGSGNALAVPFTPAAMAAKIWIFFVLRDTDLTSRQCWILLDKSIQKLKKWNDHCQTGDKLKLLSKFYFRSRAPASKSKRENVAELILHDWLSFSVWCDYFLGGCSTW